MEELRVRTKLGDLTNEELIRTFDSMFMQSTVPDEIVDHEEIVFRANRQDKEEPAESRNILYNYMMDNNADEQVIVKRRLAEGGKRSKRSKRRKSRRARKTRRCKRRRR